LVPNQVFTWMNGPIRRRQHGTGHAYSRKICTLYKPFVNKLKNTTLPQAIPVFRSGIGLEQAVPRTSCHVQELRGRFPTRRLPGQPARFAFREIWLGEPNFPEKDQKVPCCRRRNTPLSGANGPFACTPRTSCHLQLPEGLCLRHPSGINP
jgi:hypothetical protein